MAGIEIPGLGRKLRLLVDHGHFRTWNDLAESFGRSRSTVYGWGHGNGGRSPDTLPGNKLETLIDIVQSCLPKGTSREDARALIFAPVLEYETEFNSQVMISLNRIVEAEANITSGKLYLKPKPNIGLIESDKVPAPEPALSIKLGAWFRLEFQTKVRTGHVSAFQNVGQNWGAVAAHFNRETGTIALPGLKTSGEFVHMREKNEQGCHRFIVMRTPEPPPIEFTRYLADNIALDGMILRRMAHFYHEQPKNRRQLYLLELIIG